MDNRPAWVPKLESAIARGEAAYREAAQIILTELAANPDLTQAKVAEYVGHKPPWVSSLLKWYHAGCPPGGVFGPEIAARRAKISTSKFPDYSHWPVFDPAPIDESEATRMVLAAQARCEEFTTQFIMTVNALSRDGTLPLAYRWVPGDMRRDTLEKLAAELKNSIEAGSKALREVLEALDVLMSESEAA